MKTNNSRQKGELDKLRLPFPLQSSAELGLSADTKLR